VVRLLICGVLPSKAVPNSTGSVVEFYMICGVLPSKAVPNSTGSVVEFYSVSKGRRIVICDSWGSPFKSSSKFHR